jgi:hypothetical protein
MIFPLPGDQKNLISTPIFAVTFRLVLVDLLDLKSMWEICIIASLFEAKKKIIAAAGDRTRVTRVTGGNTYHYTTTTLMFLWRIFWFKYLYISESVCTYINGPRVCKFIPSLTSKRCCHAGIHAILGFSCEVVSFDFHVVNNWDYMDWPQVY